MKLVVGLGNPGPKYAGTRHNVGFDVVDRLARRWRVDLSAEKFHGWFAVTDVGADRVGLMKPTTFMNRSGQAVAAAARFYQLTPADLMVVVDDLALPPGKIRIRAEGSAGSHNGLADIIGRLGRQDWPRLRIGIGPVEGIGAQYVLSRFAEEERSVMEESLDRAADAVECWLKEGVTTAMNRYNG